MALIFDDVDVVTLDGDDGGNKDTTIRIVTDVMVMCSMMAMLMLRATQTAIVIVMAITRSEVC